MGIGGNELLDSAEKQATSAIGDATIVTTDLPTIERVESERDAVEDALAAALKGATEAGKWDVVAQLAGELQARRVARSANVVAIGTLKAKVRP